MKIALIGGSSDLGRELTKSLPYTFFNFDLRDENPNATFFEVDITKPKTLSILKSQSFDAVIHIAGIHPLIQSPDQDELMFKVNVTGFFNVLSALTKTNCKKVIYISSSSAKNIHSTYGKTKQLAEKLLELFTSANNWSSFALRTRGFTPYYSKAYTNFKDYASWVLGGAVHIQDVVRCIDLCLTHQSKAEYSQFLVDGKNDFTQEELSLWGKEMLLKKFPGNEELINLLTLKEAPTYSKVNNPVGYEPELGAGVVFKEYKNFLKGQTQ